jgi:hypothetical protein
MDPLLDLVLRAALALLFVAAAVHKLRDPARFRATLAAYRLGLAAIVGPASAVVVAVELGIAGALLAPSTRAAGLVAAALLLSAYAGAIALNLWRGRRDLDCGCLGVGGREAISWWLVARNGVLASVALAALPSVASRPLVWVDAVTGFGAFALAVLGWLATDGLLANLPGFARIREVG